MSEILLLVHHQTDLKVIERIISMIIRNNNLETTIIAPKEIANRTIPKNQIDTFLKDLLQDQVDVKVISFEANLGFPASEVLNEPTQKALDLIVEKYPDAMIILKSRTQLAIEKAQQYLDSKDFNGCIIQEHDVVGLSPRTKESIIETIQESQRAMSSPSY